MNLKYLLLFCLLIFSLPLVAQQKVEKAMFKNEPTYETLDFISMKDGRELKGNILEDTPKYIVFSNLENYKETILKKRIKKIVPTNPNYYYLETRRSIRKRGYYFMIDIAINMSPLSGYEFASGMHLSANFGKMLNEIFAIGTGTGYDVYGHHTNVQINGINFNPSFRTYSFNPILAEIRGYHFKKRVSSYYSLGLGVGLARKFQSRFDYKR